MNEPMAIFYGAMKGSFLAGALGVIDSEFGTHLVRLEKQNLGVEEGRARGVKGRRMLD